MSPAEKAAREEMADRKMNTATEKAYSKSLTNTEEAPKSFGGKPVLNLRLWKKRLKTTTKSLVLLKSPKMTREIRVIFKPLAEPLGMKLNARQRAWLQKPTPKVALFLQPPAVLMVVPFAVKREHKL